MRRQQSFLVEPLTLRAPATLRGRLIRLTLALLVPALLLSALLLWAVDVQAQRALQGQLGETTRALSLVIDRQLGERAAVLQALSTAAELRRGDWTGFDRTARRALGDRSYWLVVREADGRQRVNTRLAPGGPAPAAPAPSSWAGELGPGVLVSNLTFDPVVGAATIELSRTVRLADGRKVRLSIVGLARDFEQVFRDQGLPKQWTAAVLDGQRRIVARSRDGDRFQGQIASPDTQAAMARNSVGILQRHTLDGIPTVAAFGVIPGYGWSVVVGVPRGEMVGAATAPLLWGGALAVLLLGLGVASAVAAAGAVELPVHALARAVRGWTQAGVTAPPAQSGLREVDELARAFFEAATQLRIREAALAESQRRLQTAIEASGVGVWDWRLSDNLVEWSPEMFGIAGQAPSLPGPMLFDLWAEAIHPDDRKRARAASARTVATGEPMSLDLRMVRPDGQVRWMRSRGLAVRGADGRVERVVGANLDITDLRDKEAQLEAANARLANAVDERTRELDRIWRLSRDPFLIADPEGRWLRCSPAWTEILGWSEAEIVGRTSEWMAHPDDWERGRAESARLAAGAVVTRFESRYRTKAGDYRWFSWNAVLYEGLHYCVARDVTAEKEAADELAHAQEALRQAQKMDAIGQLTGGVAHDFNNLLTPILGSLDLVLRRQGLEARSRRLLDGALRSAERARTLVQRLLAFARRQPLQPRPVALEPLVRGMAELIGSTLGPRIPVKLELPAGLPAVIGDENQLEMALLNLAVNARDAMPEGGVLTIAAAVETVGPRAAADLGPGSYVRLTVADTGVGMDPTTLARAAEPFFTTKGVGGTGLGLSMAHGLAGQLGGALRLYSTPGAGTRVELWLPVADRPAEGSEGRDSSRLQSGQVGVALLADDEDLVRASAAEMLAELGFSVVEARSAGEALDLLEGGLRPTLLVTDHLMPGMTGAELARRVAATKEAPPVLIITGYADAADLAPDVPRLTKPFRQSDLAARVAELLAGR